MRIIDLHCYPGTREWITCQGPYVEALADEYDGKATVAKLNVDENPQVPTRFMVRGIPTLLIFKNGEVVEQMVGGNVRKADLAEKLNAHAGSTA